MNTLVLQQILWELLTYIAILSVSCIMVFLIDRKCMKALKNQNKMHTLVLTSAELELIYDQLNLIELYDDSDDNIELVGSINNKIFVTSLE